jgi:hypothetical protein
MIDFNKLAVLLDDAARTGVAVAQLSESHPDLDVTARLCRSVHPDLDVTARLCRSAPIEESPRRFSSPG